MLRRVHITSYLCFRAFIFTISIVISTTTAVSVPVLIPEIQQKAKDITSHLEEPVLLTH